MHLKVFSTLSRKENADGFFQSGPPCRRKTRHARRNSGNIGRRRPEGRWHPISHDTVLGTVKVTLGESGYEVKSEKLALNGKGTRFFGTLDLATPIATGVTLAVGIRNSTDKSFRSVSAAARMSSFATISRFELTCLSKETHRKRGQEFSGRHCPCR